MASLQIKHDIYNKKPRYSYRITRLFYVVLPGFEPGQTGPESVVLPLHHRTISTKLSSKL